MGPLGLQAGQFLCGCVVHDLVREYHQVRSYPYDLLVRVGYIGNLLILVIQSGAIHIGQAIFIMQTMWFPQGLYDLPSGPAGGDGREIPG